MRNHEQNHGFIVAKEGFKFILFGALLSFVNYTFGFTTLMWLCIGFTIFVACFFRNPRRNIPQQSGLVLSPADGKICMISDAYEKRFLKEDRKRVSIFMSVFDCHINRSPVQGQVVDTHYHAGKFHIASVDKASDLNEQNAICMEDEQKNKYVVVQIAGWVARRIVSYVKAGDMLNRGERFGLIQFGSRVDVYFPKNASVRVKVGQTVRGGETVLGEIL